MMMTSNDRCPQCNIKLIANAPAGLCPGCLLMDAVESPTPTHIGDYDILDLLGCGGMGAIYRAKQRSIGRVVALKVIRAGELATPEERRRFRAEIEAAANLDHPNIVPIYEVGEHAGCPYYTMRVYEGALDKQLHRYHMPTAAAALVAMVARAVHYGHERGVLHRDLKPANILLDEHGRPHVSDFGTAKRIGEPGMTEPGMMVGTPTYMAPEQAHGGDSSVTTAVDVYSLGVVLYELITGKPPFNGDLVSVMRALREADPVPPHKIAPAVPRDLETICLKCMEKQPGARYRTAEELADDLERFVRGDPIAARPASLTGRAWRFTRRHWLAVGVGVGMLLLLAVLAATAVSVARSQELELQRNALRTNAYAAHANAGAVAFLLREQIDELKRIAADPAVARLLQNVGGDTLEQWRSHTRFENIALYDRSGTMKSQAYSPSNNVGKDYSFRDYFIGASRLGKAGLREGHISRAFKSEADKRYKFAISTPIYDQNGWAGVLMATIGTDFAFGQKRHDHAGDAGRMEVVVALRDRSRDSTEGAGEHVVIWHDGLAHGAEVPMDSPRLRELRKTSADHKQLTWRDREPEPITDDAHRDPVPGFEGCWLAGFSTVEGTDFVVIVQTRCDAAVEPTARLPRLLIWRVGAFILAWIVVFGAGLWGYSHHRRGHRLSRRDSMLAVSPHP
jgi:hypothetical protein